MDKPTHALLVDGPGRGQVVEIPDSGEIAYAVAGEPVSLDGEIMIPPAPVKYRVAKAVIFGHLLLLGSVFPELPEADVFNAIMNDRARHAAVKLPRYRCTHQMSELPCIRGCHDKR